MILAKGKAHLHSLFWMTSFCLYSYADWESYHIKFDRFGAFSVLVATDNDARTESSDFPHRQDHQDEEGDWSPESGLGLGTPECVCCRHDLYWNVCSLLHLVQTSKTSTLLIPKYFQGLDCYKIITCFSFQDWKTHKLILQHHILATLVYWWVAAMFQLILGILFFFNLSILLLGGGSLLSELLFCFQCKGTLCLNFCCLSRNCWNFILLVRC